MSTVSSSYSSSSSKTQEVEAAHRHDVSDVSRNHQSTSSQRQQGTAVNGRSSSPSLSYSSTKATGTPYDVESVAMTNNTGFSNGSISHQPSFTSIPVLRPPTLQSEQRIQVDVASAHQQYQQRPVQPEISPSSGSTVSSSDVSSSSSGTTYQQQQQRQYEAPRAAPNQMNHSVGGQYQYQQQTQFLAPMQNDFVGIEEYRDMALHIDYGCIEAYNTALQAGDDFVPQPTPTNASANGQRFDVAKAIFNQADANRDGWISRDEFRHWAQTNPQQSDANNYTTTTTTTGSNFQQSQFSANGTSDVSAVLQQSGLAQALNNIR